jgi:spore germination protein GerM
MIGAGKKRKPLRSVWFLVGVLLVVFLVFLWGRSGTPPPEKFEFGKVTLPGFLQSLETKQRSPVQLFFPGKNLTLVPENREIYDTTEKVDCLRQIVLLLLSGPRSSDLLPVLPSGYDLRELYLRKGIAYVDLEVKATGRGGADCLEEYLGIKAITESLKKNFPEVEKVEILLNGREARTLLGHIALQ